MCTLEKRQNLFLLNLTSTSLTDEHRLSPTVITSLLSTLRRIKSESKRGDILITTSTGKFFSNGFDLPWAQSANTKSEALQRLRGMVVQFKPVVAEFISLPIPTIAAVNGHAAAAGFPLALSHDYVMMRSDKGVLYMSEVDIGLPIPDYFTALFRAKIGSVRARRDILLRGAKVKGEEAVRSGIVDAAYDSEEKLVEATMRLGDELGKRKWNGAVYAEIRKSLYPELCGVLGLEIGKLLPKL